MKRLFLTFIVSCIVCQAMSQELAVKDFRHDASDLSAVVHQVKDLNDSPCALIKVGIVATNVEFEGDIVSTVDKGSGEYWVYMIEGSSWLNVRCAEYVPFRYEFEPLEKNSTYILQLVQGGNDVLKSIIPVNLPAVTSLTGKSKPGVSFNMILVEPGMYQMGATDEQNSTEKDEKPVRWVRISRPFYISETEVTQALYQYVTNTNPSVFQDPDKPVENVSWQDAKLFLEKLSTITGSKFRMPTEAEWEYVARGGNKTGHYKYSGSNNVNEVGWYIGNSQNQTHKVKSKAPNELGVYDMCGNVWEFCIDVKDDYSKIKADEIQDPVNVKPDNGDRVRRGGAWDSAIDTKQDQLRNAYRRRAVPNEAQRCNGIRLVLTVE